MLSTTSPPDVVRGVQTPRVMHVPPHVTSAAEEAIELAESCGLILDPWQQLVLDGALGERADGRWASFDVGIAVPRQNGKGGILEARELAGLFLFDERLIVHSAHLFETSMEHFERMLLLIQSNPDLERGLHRVSRAHGEQGFTLTRKYGSRRMKFKTRTKGGGRGLSGDVVVMDEAMEISESSVRALMPTMTARPNPQIWYCGSAVDQLEHANGVVFARLRERGHRGDDPSMSWFEFSIDPDEGWREDPAKVASDPKAWAQANPALGIRITEEYIANERRSFAGDLRGFGTERLGVGDWPDTAPAGDEFIPMWGELLDPDSMAASEVVFAIDVTPERDWAAIGSAGRRADGLWHVEVIDHQPGTRWLVPELLRLRETWGPLVIAVDGKGPAASLIPELEKAGLRVFTDEPSEDAIVWVASTQDMAQACGAFYDAAVSDEMRHLGQGWLSSSLRSAKKRDLSDAWAWARKSGGDICPLVAVTLALRGFQLFGDSGEIEPFMFVT